ncbi:hypothetical protein BS50DRAFT_674612 [Corynespora cassiicola Philippines]|uniref:Uncharacterized protein n=1 Tax=Corynespora cassiicola Philippines TaxID=1448308 RepID=A0A2T2NXM1_CORCC|nr:hypothetical protein BS50DRAFT_674612 [Corynespora cassiicola Philippines]
MPSIAKWVSLLAAVGDCSAKSLWSSTPATDYPRIIQQAYLLGNGKLGAMPFGSAGKERIVLNVDSLWSGGPFESTEYTGGNPPEPKYEALSGIRDWIFQNVTGNVSQLLGGGDYYGSFRVLGNLSITHNASAVASSYRRELDLSTGIYTTKYTDSAGSDFATTVFCSYPDQVCIYQINSTAALPEISVKYENTLIDSSLANSSCGSDYARTRGVTQLGPPEGLLYESVAKIIGPANSTRCTSDGALVISQTPGLHSISIAISAETNYDSSKGNAENDYSFRGVDPSEIVEKTASDAASKTVSELTKRHLEDYQDLTQAFSLELPDPNGSAEVETATLFENYSASNGNPFVESLVFDYSRHLLISSSRENSLPANLQGKWASELFAAWSADYHANINIQMNYWGAEQTGLGGGVQDGLWRYMQETWVPRGTETAKLLYDAPGWVTHSEMNIYGHTAMKNDAGWANYPASGAWMMQHVTDHFAYSQNLDWLSSTGYPLLKGVTEFWLSQLQEDTHWNDGTLVVNPCNSPETGPTTFGCTHWHQLIHQLFNSVLYLGPLVSDSETFLANVSTTLTRLDKGFHLTSWGGVKEWKIPEPQSSIYDFENSTHRHLSHLWGWYPGLTLSSPSPSYLSGYTNETIQDAIATSLYSRGEGNAEDANAGWGKVWRSACWARLNNTERAYFHLKYAIEQNFVGNALSMYSGKNMPFQIDANFGFSGAVLSMLVVDIEEPGLGEGERTVVLGPAIPAEWAGGKVKGLRLRGGGSVDFGWNEEGIVDSVSVGQATRGVKFVDKTGKAIP